MDQVERFAIAPDAGVCVEQALADANHHLCDKCPRQRLSRFLDVIFEDAPEVLASDEFHDDVVEFVVLADVVDFDDVGVLELCGEVSFVEEDLVEFGGFEGFGVDDLDHDVFGEPTDPKLLCLPDLGLSTFSKARFDDVFSACDGCAFFDDHGVASFWLQQGDSCEVMAESSNKRHGLVMVGGGVGLGRMFFDRVLMRGFLSREQTAASRVHRIG